MIRLAFKVFFKDGREETVSGGTMLFRAWETYAIRHGLPTAFEDAPRVTALAVIAHKALGVSEGFDVWAETVDAIEDADAQPVDPTPPGPSIDSTSSSRSRSDGASPTSDALTIESSLP